MKKGSADDPFAEEPQESDEEDDEPELEVTREESREQERDSSPSATEPRGIQTESTTGTEQAQSLPYIYARDSVKDQRQQRPIFLRDDVEDGIPDLVDRLEDSFGEQVYRTDVLEAAVVVAQRNPDLVEETLEEWGYGWK